MLDLPEAHRISALHDRGIDDPIIVSEVESLLRALHGLGSFLSTPPCVAAQEVVPDVAVGTRLGAWRITRLMGRGGMGDVYEAERADGSFEQRVAVKLLQREAASQLPRFQAERQILASLDHDGIARLHDGGMSEDGRPYMVMEYIEGRPITDFCTLTHATFEQRLGLFMQVCSAVAFAHRSRIVHRDLKPSNILVTADGVVKLLDFGIAKLLDAQLARITQASAVPMTPICAAPEQLTGQPITSATDVYALGLLLFELLTGTHPWMGTDTPMLQAMRTVLERPAPIASRAAETHVPSPVPVRLIRGDLDAIVAKALRKEPEHRYSTVTALELDVARVLRREAIQAREGARLYVVGHTLRRYRWLAAGATAVLISLAAGLGAAHWLAQRALQASVAHTVAVVGFNNLSQKDTDAWLAAALTEMLGTELSAVDIVQIVPDDIVRDALKGLKRTGTSDYDADTLARLGEHLGADYVLNGSYFLTSTGENPRLRLDIALRSVRTGMRVATLSQQADLADLTGLVREAGVSLRGKLAVKAETGESFALLANAQPPSVDVARRIGVAHDNMQHYQASRATNELLEAIAESPGYAPAYLDLSEAWSAIGYRQKAIAAAEQAASRAGTLPPQMRLRVDAVLQTAKYQWAKAADDWNALVKLGPAVLEYRLHAIDALVSAGTMAAAQTALTDLRRISKGNDDPRVELAAARVAAALDDPKAAADHAQQALRLAERHETPGITADARVQLASSQTRLGQLDTAGTGLRAAIDDYHALGNPHGEAEARRALAHVLVGRNGADARDEDRRAMAIYQDIGDIGGIAGIYRDLCEMLWEAGDRDGAEAAAHRGLEISREIGDLKLQAWTLRAIATLASDESASDDVMRTYREVTSLTERSGDRGGHVWSLAAYADVARTRGDMIEARGACTQAVMEAAELTDPQFSIFSNFTCALVQFDLGQPAAATALLASVVEQSRANGNGVYLANAEMMLAQIDLESSRCSQALGRLRDAVQGFAATEAKSGEALAEALHALCAQDLGDSAGRDRAIARARTLRAGITARQEVYFVDIVSAQLGFAAEPKGDAIARLNAIAADAESRHWLGWSLEAKLGAWQLAHAAGDKDLALHLRAELERAAKEHGMGRILARIQYLAK